MKKTIFEAPLQHQQVWFIENYGVETNFANIAPNDVIGLETFRRGLRTDLSFYKVPDDSSQRRDPNPCSFAGLFQVTM